MVFKGSKEIFSIEGRKETPAWPASIRWTAPEVLTHPTSEESDTDVFSPACDVYSFALTMWEAVSVSDPWCELQDESMVSAASRWGQSWGECEDLCIHIVVLGPIHAKNKLLLIGGFQQLRPFQGESSSVVSKL